MTLSTKIGIDKPSYLERNLPLYKQLIGVVKFFQRWPVIPIVMLSILVLLAVFLPMDLLVTFFLQPILKLLQVFWSEVLMELFL